MTAVLPLQVDAGADEIARQCRQLISRYRENLAGLQEEQGEEAREHHEAVCEGLEQFLKQVVGTHSEMRAVRVSRHLEMKRLSRLEVTSSESRARQGGAGQEVSQQVSVRCHQLRKQKGNLFITFLMSNTFYKDKRRKIPTD